MIMRIAGTLLDHGLDWMLVDTQGVGYRVHVSLAVSSQYQSGDAVTLWTHEAVRDDRRELYGFASKQDLELFWKLIGVNGVGPKVAQKILGVYEADILRGLVLEGDANAIKKVPGVGTKTAQKIVLELRGSIDLEALKEQEQAASGGDQELLSALTSLGYAPAEAKEMAKSLPEDLESIEDKIKAILKGTTTV